MKSLFIHRALLGAILFSGAALNTHAESEFDPPIDHNDEFEMHRGTIIRNGSATYSMFALEDMFGGELTTFSEGEKGHTIFADVVEGNTDFVEIETPFFVRLAGYRVTAWGDLGRHLNVVRVKVDTANNEVYDRTIDEFQAHVVPLPLGNIVVTNDHYRPLSEPVFSRHFRFEFVRWDTPINAGPRIVEIDAVTIPNAEIPEVALLQPSQESTNVFPASIPLEVTASDPDGIFSIEFRAASDQGQTWVLDRTGQNTNRFASVANSLEPGTYYIYAVATDRMGGIRESDRIRTVIEAAPTEPILLQNPSFSSEGDGVFRFELLNLSLEYPFVVEVSDNLIDWFPLSTNTPSPDSEQYVEFLPPGISARFYRVYQDSEPAEPPTP